MRVAAIQHDIDWELPEATCERVRPLIADAATQGARLVVLPEMFATGFSMRPDRIAEDEGGPIERFLVDRSSEHDVHVIASVAQRGPDGAYRNNALVVSPDGTLRRYAKIHPFSYAGEHERYAAGQDFLTVDLDGLRVSVFVCYDLRFADEFWARALDTDVYVVVANWPAPRHEHWRLLLRARAVENQAFVIGVNRVGDVAGRHEVLHHEGGSAVIDPLGRVLVEDGAEPSVLLSEVDTSTVQEIRTNFPFLADRR